MIPLRALRTLQPKCNEQYNLHSAENRLTRRGRQKTENDKSLEIQIRPRTLTLQKLFFGRDLCGAFTDRSGSKDKKIPLRALRALRPKCNVQHHLHSAEKRLPRRGRQKTEKEKLLEILDTAPDSYTAKVAHARDFCRAFADECDSKQRKILLRALRPKCNVQYNLHSAEKRLMRRGRQKSENDKSLDIQTPPRTRTLQKLVFGTYFYGAFPDKSNNKEQKISLRALRPKCNGQYHLDSAEKRLMCCGRQKTENDTSLKIQTPPPDSHTAKDFCGAFTDESDIRKNVQFL